VTTHTSPCARQGVAPFLSTLVLLSVAGLIVPAASAASIGEAAGIAAEASQSPQAPSWSVEPLLQDPADMPDDDDDDPDAQQDASSAISVARGLLMGIDSGSRLVRAAAPSLSSRALEGHYLRGPPAGAQDSSDIDDDRDDDDDDDHLESASCSITPGVRAFLPFSFQQRHVRTRAHDRQWLRAP